MLTHFESYFKKIVSLKSLNIFDLLTLLKQKKQTPGVHVTLLENELIKMMLFNSSKITHPK